MLSSTQGFCVTSLASRFHPKARENQNPPRVCISGCTRLHLLLGFQAFSFHLCHCQLRRHVLSCPPRLATLIWWIWVFDIFLKNVSYQFDMKNVRRKFRSQTSDNMDRWKAEMGRVREKRRVEERRSEKRKGQKKEDADARKGRKVAKHCFSNHLWLRRVEK